MITFKNIEENDQPFVEKVFRSTREKELNLTNWPEEQKHNFIIMQLMAQQSYYKNNFKGATYQLIFYNKKPAGTLSLWETDKEICLLDISLLPEFQKKGIGRKILTGIIKASGEKNKTVTLHVIIDNPAKKLYKSLGFQHISSTSTHDYMERKPSDIAE